MTAPAVHPDYQIALAEYNTGLLPDPPCECCALPIPDAGLTGARLCVDCTADLRNVVFRAPTSRSGRRWRWGRTLRGGRMLLSPLGDDVPRTAGGVKSIWRTLDELREWEVVARRR